MCQVVCSAIISLPTNTYSHGVTVCTEVDHSYCRYSRPPPDTHEVGHYWSQALCMRDHISQIDSICSMEIHKEASEGTDVLYTDTILHAIVFDFIAYVSQCLGYDRNGFCVQKVQCIRHMLLTDLSTVKSKHFHENRLYGVFQYIIENAKPVYDDIKPCSLSCKHDIALYEYFKNKSINTNVLNTEAYEESCKVISFYNYSLTSHTLNSIHHGTHRVNQRS